MTVELLLTLCGLALAAATFFIGRTTKAKDSGQEMGEFTAEIRTDIRYIKDGMSEIKAKVEIIGVQQSDIKTDVAITKRDLETAFKKIDKLGESNHGN